MSPVTQIADVDVKAAVRNEPLPGSAVAIGSQSSRAPTRIASAKASATSCAG